MDSIFPVQVTMVAFARKDILGTWTGENKSNNNNKQKAFMCWFQFFGSVVDDLEKATPNYLSERVFNIFTPLILSAIKKELVGLKREQKLKYG